MKTTDRILRWCDTHDQPAWDYDDGSVQCMYDLIVESCNEHVLGPVLLADPASKCRQIGGPVTLAQSLHMVQPGQEIPKLVFDVCEQVLERFTVCALAPEPAEPLGAVGRAMAKAGLTADDVEAVIASPAPSVDPEEG